MIKETFGQSCSEFQIQHIKPILNPKLENLFVDKVLVMDERLKSEFFDPGTIHDAAKCELMDSLERHCRSDLFTRCRLRKAKFVLSWHGVKSDNAAKSIADTGLANLKETDAGYFGSGLYTALEAAYACKYASGYPNVVQKNDRGCWAVLLCMGVLGNTYPITACSDDYSGPLPPVSARQGTYFAAPMKTKCDTHVVGVKGPAYLPPLLPSEADYHELVFEDHSQLLPLAVVEFNDSHHHA
jgi:hypothetical protein